MKKLGLYIHIPFCKKKCYYCDFLSYTDQDIYINDYFSALYDEIKGYNNTDEKYIISSIYVGGGTPTYVNYKYIEKLIRIIFDKFNIVVNAEISIEGNPGTFTNDKLKAYKEIGINRLSMGLQCWQDNLLKNIGRIHNKEDFIKSYSLARKIGFNNINVDLIFGLPEQSLDNWIETLREITNLSPEHISCYSLKVEKNTVFYALLKNNQIEIDDDLDRMMYHFTIEYFEKNSYNHYELSNFAKNNNKCFHNLIYWEMKPYIGFGLGAHSFINLKRYSNEEKLDKYIYDIQNGKDIIRNVHLLSTNELKEEYIFLGLRKIQGIDDRLFKKSFGESIFDEYNEIIKNLNNKELIIIENNCIKLSKKGLDYANYVFRSFIDS